jgi:glycosyltransferase involved in cell wall biosynthesis
MKIALVHDALVNRGGAERVFQIFCEMFPEAAIYTAVYLPDKTLPFFKSRTVKTTPLQRIVRNENQLKLLFPLANYFMQQMRLDPCDIILSSSTFCGKYVNAEHHSNGQRPTRNFCYCYTPFRLIWHPESYIINNNYQMEIKLAKPFFSLFKKWDYLAAQRVHQFIAMTDETRGRILSIYKKDSLVVSPPIDTSMFFPGSGPGDYFLLVSRLEPYKKVDLVIRAFNELQLPLIIVGTGTLLNQFQALAKKNIQFLHSISDEELLRIYQGSLAVVFPQQEDYGLVPLEANACGKAVICYGVGGVETTMIPYSDKTQHDATALFFYEQSVESVKQAIRRFLRLKFNREALISNAQRFNKEQFCNKINSILQVADVKPLH